MQQLSIIIAYFLVMVTLGIFSRRQIKNKTDYFVAGRRGSTLFITGSLFATAIGGSATVGIAGLGFNLGLTGIWWLWVGSLGLIVLGLVFAGKLRKFRLFTLPDLIDRSYGRTVGMLASVLIVIAWLGVIAAQIVATGSILGALGMGDPVMWMVIFTVVAVFYTTLGGQYANLKTDIAQGVIIFFGIIGGAVTLLGETGGSNGLVQVLPAGKLDFLVSAVFGIYDLTALLFLVGATYVAGPDMFSRVLSARDEKTARKSTLWAALLIGLFAIGPVTVGISMSVLHPEIAAEQAFPFMAANILPPLMGGVLLAGLVGATMSSADSCMLSAGTILTNNVIGKIKSDLPDNRVLLISRCAVVVIGIASLGLALFLRGIISSLMFAYTVFSAGVIPLVIAAFYKEKLRITTGGALSALLGGGGTALLATLNGIPYLDLGALGISVVLLLCVSLVQNHVRSRR